MSKPMKDEPNQAAIDAEQARILREAAAKQLANSAPGDRSTRSKKLKSTVGKMLRFDDGVARLGRGTKMHYIHMTYYKNSLTGEIEESWSTECGQAYGRVGYRGLMHAVGTGIENVTCAKCLKGLALHAKDFENLYTNRPQDNWLENGHPEDRQ